MNFLWHHVVELCSKYYLGLPAMQTNRNDHGLHFKYACYMATNLKNTFKLILRVNNCCEIHRMQIEILNFAFIPPTMYKLVKVNVISEQFLHIFSTYQSFLRLFAIFPDEL